MKYRMYSADIDPRGLIVVTDLDGTLLDFDDLSFDPARPALTMLRKLDVPVICCSSKTPSEIEYWRRKIGLSGPFICENGAAVFFPADQFDSLTGELPRRSRYIVKEIGLPKPSIRRVFEEVRRDTQIPLVGFSDMDLPTIRSLCGFRTTRQARASAAREYSEPFVFPAEARNDRTINAVISRFRRRGLNVIRGRRFFHLVGNNDKGKAVEIMLGAYEAIGDRKTTVIGLGDSKNDLEMLRVADIPVLVMGKNRRYDKEVRTSVDPILAGRPGPSGWNRAIERILG